jgi:hypothetical protein
MTATPQPHRLHRFANATIALLRPAGGALRDLWLMIGLTLILFLGLEGLYRVRAAILADRPDPARRVVESTLHPYAKEAWWGPFQDRDGLRVRLNQFDPYRAFWGTPASSRYVNVDSAGRRVTPQERAPDGATIRQVFMLGGSTMWGYTSRDSFDIPALVARELRERGVTDVEVVNLAQGAYNSTQEATTLLLELAHGRIPAAAVSLNGYNDVATAAKYGGAGHIYGEAGIAQQIRLGRRDFWGELIGLGRHSALIAGLRGKLGLDRPEGPPRPDPDGLCLDIVAYYRGITRATGALGHEWGFPVLHFLQPLHSVSNKVPTAWEGALPVSQIHTRCMRAIEAAMSRDPGPVGFVSLAAMFDAESATVFVDQHAHVTEAANRQIAARIARELIPLLSRAGPTPPSVRR